MNALIDAALDHPRTVLLALVMILIGGSVAYVEIPKESDPDITIPIIYVLLSHEGISPEDAERLLVRPMEKQLRTIEGVKEMRSRAFEDGASVTLEFEAGFDIDVAIDDVREQVDVAKAELPEDTDEPTVNEVNLSLFPVIVITLSGNVPERSLLRLARDLQDEIEGISSVLRVEIAGDRDELVEVLVDPLRLESYGMTAQEVINNIRRSNRLIAAGALDTGQGRFAIKVPGLLKSVEDVLRMPVVTGGDAVVVLADIATVRRTFKDAEGFARVNGRPALVLEVSKRTGENIIETIERVRAVTEAERATWPAGIEVGYAQDKSVDIRNLLADLQNNVIAAVILVMVVVLATLGVRPAALVGIAIPGSFLTAILALTALGLTINVVVLFSLILAVGMLVDGAIVVTEYADRKMTDGLSRRDAYALGAKRMAWPITASVATTLAAFVPLVFWPGVVGEFMKFLPLTVLFTLSASLMMALIFVPTLGGLIGRPGSVRTRTLQALAVDAKDDLAALTGPTGYYVRVLRAALRHPGKVLAAAFAVLVAVQWVYATRGRGIEFFPEVEPERAVLQIHARGNLSVEEKDVLVSQLEEMVVPWQEIETVYTRSGAQQLASEEAQDIIGTIQLEFLDWDQRRPAKTILGEILRRAKNLAGIKVESREEEAGPPVGKPIQVELAARDPRDLPGAIATLRRGLDEIGGFTNIEDSLPMPGIEWRLGVDRAQAAKFGADITVVGNAVQLVTNGVLLDSFRPDDSDEEVDIRARYPVEYRNIEQLNRIRVNTETGVVPIGNFVSLAAMQRVGTIDRADGRRVMSIKADVEAGHLPDDKVRELRAWLPGAGLPAGVDVTFKGEDEEQNEARQFLTKAFAVALFLMAIILVTQFNSFYSALLILSAVVLSTIGVMIGLLVTGQPFGIVMSGIGVIALAGIVVNNNIVLIDTYDRLAATADSALDAILRTGAQRLRPVLLTTVTTMLGLMPMVLRLNIDFVSREVTVGAPATQWWTQLATSIVFGLGFATVLTLVVTPCALMVRANIGTWRKARAAGENGRPPPNGPPAGRRAGGIFDRLRRLVGSARNRRSDT